MKLCRVFPSLVILLALASCGAQTKMVSHWADEQAKNRDPGKTLIIAVVRTEQGRQALENSLVKALKQQGVYAEPSYKLVEKSEDLLERDRIIALVKEHDYKSVLVTDLKGVDEETVLSPPTRYMPMKYYDNLYDYHEDARFWENQPEYYQTFTTFKVESNLYDAETAQLIWSAATQTNNADTASDAIQSLQHTIMKNLAQKGLLGSL
jgi:hypothetical protein